MRIKIGKLWYDSKDSDILIHFEESELKLIRTGMDEVSRRYSSTIEPMSLEEWMEWAEIPTPRKKLLLKASKGKIKTAKFIKKMKAILKKGND